MRTTAQREAFALACNSSNWACTGKDAFTTFTMAEKVMNKMRRSRGKHKFGNVVACRCPYCTAIHIGGQA